MNRHNSWVVNSAKTEALRKHEQGHFDITAIGASEIHDRMAFITGVSAGELASQKDELIAEVQVYINDANARYDEETEHGTNVTRQNSWEANIARVKGDVNGIISDLP